MSHNEISPGLEGRPCCVFKGTCKFKLKLLPYGSNLNYKAHYCVRRDLQIERVGYFENYPPVGQWFTIFLELTMIISTNWNTKQVDYTNAFNQEDLKEEVHTYTNHEFWGSDGIWKVIRLIKCLVRPPKYSLISSGLVSLNVDSFNQKYIHVSSWNITSFYCLCGR